MNNINYLCLTCKRDCKQSPKVDIVKCPLYEAKDQSAASNNALKLTIVLLAILFWAVSAFSLDLSIIKQIESSGNPLAYNKSSHARGLFQITPICLKEYNNFHAEKYNLSDLFNPIINEKIAKWYIEKRIPQMLKHFGKETSLENILISYNAGISYVVSGKPLPLETVNYIKKYKGEK
jgi:hypothetical protein